MRRGVQFILKNEERKDMNKKQALWLFLKGSSYVCLGLIVYNLFCIKGT